MPEKRLSTERIYEGRILNLRVDTVGKESGALTQREIIEHKPVIAVVALDGDSLLMVRQFRTAIGKDLLEIPAGGIDAGEEPEAAVVREMQEETGFKPRSLVRLGGIYSAPGFTEEYLHIYLATDLEASRLHAEDTDEIEVVGVHLAQLPDMIASGEIEDSKTLAALTMFREYQARQSANSPQPSS